MLHLFYEIWGTCRAWILAVLVAFFCILYYQECCAHVMDGIEYVGPGSQAESTMKQAERKENKAAYKRERKAEKSKKKDTRSHEQKKKDKHKAAKHMKEHGA
jgi:hypothetical protein